MSLDNTYFFNISLVLIASIVDTLWYLLLVNLVTFHSILELIKNKSYIIDIGSNDGVALKPFKDLGFKRLLGIEPAKNLAKLANKNKIKTFNGFLEKKNIKKIKKNADLILASNVFAHSDKLEEMSVCMLNLLGRTGTIVIEVQYLMNTLKDLTFDNIYHEHYNYWSLTSLNNFFVFFESTTFALLLANEKILFCPPTPPCLRLIIKNQNTSINIQGEN